MNFVVTTGLLATLIGVMPPIKALTPQTVAEIAQVENLNGETNAQLRAHLGDIVKKVLAASAARDGDFIKGVMSDQYRDIWEKTLAWANTERPTAHYIFDREIGKDFNSYTLQTIDRVMIEKDVAFVQAKIIYHPGSLAEIRNNERGITVTNDADEFKDVWYGWGQVSNATIQEKEGKGFATYYLVLQKGTWRLHQTYLSERPMPSLFLKGVAEDMRTLVE